MPGRIRTYWVCYEEFQDLLTFILPPFPGLAWRKERLYKPSDQPQLLRLLAFVEVRPRPLDVDSDSENLGNDPDQSVFMNSTNSHFSASVSFVPYVCPVL